MCNRFVILSHGRTGSTALCGALSAHPHIHAYKEIFHCDTDARTYANGQRYENGMNAARFCEEHVFWAPNEFDKTTIGFKLFFFHARSDRNAYSIWPYLINDHSIKVIKLLRRNVVDCYISEQRSKQSGVW